MSELNRNLNINIKISILNSDRIDTIVFEYLNEILGNLYIEIGKKESSSLIELVSKEEMANWFFESPESSLIFFKKNDYLEKGNIYLSSNNTNYSHSWIVFNYEGTEYIFDSKLNIICHKGLYYDLFEPKVTNTISSYALKSELLAQLNNRDNKTISLKKHKHFNIKQKTKVKGMGMNYYYS